VVCIQPGYMHMYQLNWNLNYFKFTLNILGALISGYNKGTDIAEVSEKEADSCKNSPDCDIDEKNNQTAFILTRPFDVKIFTE